MPDAQQATLGGMPEPLDVPTVDGVRFPNVELNFAGGVPLAITSQARSDLVSDLEMTREVSVSVSARLSRKGFKETSKGNVATYTFEVLAVEEWDGAAIDEAAAIAEEVASA